MTYDENDQRTFENIQCLVINKMNYEWNDVCKVLKHFPNLTELKVCFNIITSITNINVPCLNGLKMLDLESNPIYEWKNMRILGELKSLEVLYANEIRIKDIFFDDCDYSSKTKYFQNLKILAINDNLVDNVKLILSNFLFFFLIFN